jgi:hypothetical protein
MTAVTFGDGYQTLTLSLPNAQAKTCGCGAPLPPGAGIARLYPEINPRKGCAHFCLPCALGIIRGGHGFRKLNKDYLHFLEYWGAPSFSPDEAARLFGEVYEEINKEKILC